MYQCLIIVKKRNNYNPGECEQLRLPTTPEQIERVLHKLGCSLVKADYEIIYSEFGYPEIDNKVNRYSDILALNKIAKMLQSYNGTPGELCAELVYKGCENETDIIAHLANRTRLVVLESCKNITEYASYCFYTEFWEGSKCKRMTYEEYEDDVYYDNGTPLWKKQYDCAMESLMYKKFRFTQYGLVYEDDLEALKYKPQKAPMSFDDIVVPF